MKRLKIKGLFALTFIVTAMIISFSSCSKDEEITADYVGTWVSNTSFEGSEAKETMTLTPNSVTNLLQIKDPTKNTWVDYIKIKGSIVVNKQILTVTLTEIGLGFDFLTGEPTATMTTYKAGSGFFELIIEEAVGGATFTSEYSVSGNTLTLKTDDNDDGDYLDEDEAVTYTRQQ